MSFFYIFHLLSFNTFSYSYPIYPILLVISLAKLLLVRYSIEVFPARKKGKM